MTTVSEHGSLATFIAEAGITFTFTETDRNPYMDPQDRGARHYRCSLRRKGQRMSCVFTKGSALKYGVELAEVLDCLASDAAGVENAGAFEDWAGEYGYDTDSRKAWNTWNVCHRQAASLRRVLGEDLYQRLLWHTERE